MTIKNKLITIGLIVLAFVLLYLFTPLGELLNLERLQEQKNSLLDLVRERWLISALVFVLIYIGAVAFSLPGATVLSLMGGFFFGPLYGVLFINVGATTGAFLIFLAARYFLGKDIQVKYKDKLAVINREVDNDGRSYFLMVRLMPVFPFFLINLLAGFTRISPWTFLWTTSVGIIPGSFVYAYLGATGANAGEGGFNLQIFLALFFLGVLSLLPVVVKKIKKKREVSQ